MTCLGPGSDLLILGLCRLTGLAERVLTSVPGPSPHCQEKVLTPPAAWSQESVPPGGPREAVVLGNH